MQNTALKDILTSQVFTNFVNTAGTFCSFIETHPGNNAKEFLKSTLDHLLLLYNYGRNLLSVPCKNQEPSTLSVMEEKMQEIQCFIQQRVPFRYYWTVLNSIDTLHKPETGCGDLVEDLCAIYRHLKQPLLLWHKGNNEEKVLASWWFKFNFDRHWGDHCINTLFAIHCYLQKER